MMAGRGKGPERERIKSAYEIALEKLRAQDRERGEAAPAALSAAQKEKIAKARKVCEARLAEREILHRSDREKVLAAGDPEGLAKIEEEYARDRRRYEDQRDAEIEAIRRQEK